MFDLANKYSIYSTTSSFQNTGINRLGVSSKFNVDILSVASIKQLNLINAQWSTITSHKSVRNFFIATELDDADPDCHKDITWDHVDAVSKFCLKRSRYMSPIYRYLKSNYAPPYWLKKKKNPAGWLCAQVRPYSGLMKAYLHYKASGEALPDYFLIFDDDTYYNMELFQRTFEDNDSATAKVYAGCLIRWGTFTFPYGGFGSIISKGALRKLFQGIRCHGFGEDSTNATTVTDVTPPTEDEAALCRRLKEDNVGELKYFTSGMNLVELMYRYSSTERYRDVFNWTSGFCMHSDWVLGYFVNYYNVSTHVSDEYYENVPHARFESYKKSEWDLRAKKKGTGFCKNDDNCKPDTEICHRAKPEWMKEENARWKLKLPYNFH